MAQVNEQSKAVTRRSHDPNFARRYFVGDGIDIGCGHDPIGKYRHLFPLMENCRTNDMMFGDGDAQYMEGYPDDTWDWVASAHCLEHLHDPLEALRNWLRILKPGGHMVVTFPDEDLYEQGVWPSTFNPDHKHTFTMSKCPYDLGGMSWTGASVDVLGMVQRMGDEADVRKVEVLDHANWDNQPRWDQTQSPTAESAIEIVVRKRFPEEIKAGGKYPPPLNTPPPVKNIPAGKGD